MSFSFATPDSQSDPSNNSNIVPSPFLAPIANQGFSFNAPNSSTSPTTQNSAFALTPANATPFASSSVFTSNINNFSQQVKNPNPPQSSLFGSAPASNVSTFVSTSNNSNSGLFSGNSNTGLFNATPSTQNTSSFGYAPNYGGSGLFGASNSFGGSSSNTGSSLFGKTSNTNPTSNNYSGLGSSPNTTTSGSSSTNTGSNLFGQSSNSTSAPSGCFGAVNNAPNSNPGLFSSTKTSPSFYHNTPQPVSSPAPSFGTGFNFAPNPPGLFGNPGQFGHPNNFFNGPSGTIPKFEEIPRNTVRHPYNISFSEAGSQTDLIIIVNYTDTYKLCLKSVVKQCGIFKDLKEGENTEIELEIPFPETFFEALFWIVYRCDEKLTNYIQSFKTLLEVHACFNILKVNRFLNTNQMLIDTFKIKSSICNMQSFPAVLNKKFIDLGFIEKIAEYCFQGLFGSCGYHLIKTAILFEWLGERECETEDDANVLQKSEEFRSIGKVLERMNCFPVSMHDYASLCVRYPIASQIITLQQVLRSFNLLRT